MTTTTTIDTERDKLTQMIADGHPYQTLRKQRDKINRLPRRGAG